MPRRPSSHQRGPSPSARRRFVGVEGDRVVDRNNALMARHSSMETISQSKSVACEWCGSKSADSPQPGRGVRRDNREACAWHRQSDVVGGPPFRAAHR